MVYEKYPNQAGQNFPVATQYGTFPGSSVSVPQSPQYGTFPPQAPPVPEGALNLVLPKPQVEIAYSTVAPPAFSPSDIVGVIDWWQSFAGGVVSNPNLTVTGSGVSSWVGQHAGNDFVQATDANRPARNATDATLNNLQTFTTDGSNDSLRCTTIARPAPGTTPTFCYWLFKQTAWTANKGVVAFGSSFQVLHASATPILAMTAPTSVNLNAGATLNNWRRGEVLYTNTTGDMLHLGSTTQTGASAGNNAGASLTIGANHGLSTFVAASWAFYFISASLPTLSELIALDDYVANLIGTTAPF